MLHGDAELGLSGFGISEPVLHQPILLLNLAGIAVQMILRL
jgi:hypothetical protein